MSDIQEEQKRLYKRAEEKYNKLKQTHDELERKYLDLRCRYTTQNDELIRLKIQLSKEGNNDNTRSK